jgi:hypothetical protein
MHSLGLRACFGDIYDLHDEDGDPCDHDVYVSLHDAKALRDKHLFLQNYTPERIAHVLEYSYRGNVEQFLCWGWQELEGRQQGDLGDFDSWPDDMDDAFLDGADSAYEGYLDGSMELPSREEDEPYAFDLLEVERELAELHNICGRATEDYVGSMNPKALDTWLDRQIGRAW